MLNTHLRYLQLPEMFTIYRRCLLFTWDEYNYLRCSLLTEMFKDTWDNHYSPEIGLWVQQSLGPGRDADKHWGGGSGWGRGRGWGRHLLSCINNRSICHCCDTSVTRINNENQKDWYTGKLQKYKKYNNKITSKKICFNISNISNI